MVKGLILLACLVFAGCAGEFYVGHRRIDEVQQTQVMHEKPWYCAYFNCDKGGK